ncbi:hypothetical protein GCM10027615_60110 [Plantactinospora veratri]
MVLGIADARHDRRRVRAASSGLRQARVESGQSAPAARHRRAATGGALGVDRQILTLRIVDVLAVLDGRTPPVQDR